MNKSSKNVSSLWDETVRKIRKRNFRYFSFIIFTSAICHFTSYIYSQDIHFSQFTQSPLTVNPANAGTTSWVRSQVNFRNQWNNMVPYNTIAASFDQKVKKRWQQREGKTRTLLFKSASSSGLGWGVNAYNDKAGDGRIGTLQGNFSLAYQVQLAKEKMLAGGMQLGFVQRTINYNNFNWENQYDAASGNFNHALSAQENLSGSHYIYPDVAAGLIYTYKKNERYMRGNDQRDIQAGISVFHFNRPKYSFFDEGERLHSKLIFHASGILGIKNSNMALVPGILFTQQVRNREILFGSLIRYLLKEDSKYTGYVKGAAISLGGYYRNNDAFVAAGFLEFSSYGIGISYDINVSKLRTATNGIGGFEITLRFLNPSPFLFTKASFN
ncbi:MAG: PorP/SprF family type IX secretion system membrane protein [Bacteroidetes bacterium]|nr:PorP/SprF family type IX secretion system membrane protein [Bacteroidota bacterium]